MVKYRKRLSYTPILEKACKTLKPQRILEWGPGDSTSLMAKLCPDADILSIEDDPAWYPKNKRRHGGAANVEMLLCHKGHGYITLPLRYVVMGQDFEYDLIFIDGEANTRVDCLVVASLVINLDGLVILHDAERKSYRAGLEAFAFSKTFEDEFTAIAAIGVEGFNGMLGKNEADTNLV